MTVVMIMVRSLTMAKFSKVLNSFKKRVRVDRYVFYLFIFLFLIPAIYGEEVPRRLCAFVEMDDISTGKFDGDVLKDIKVIGKGIRQIQGVTFNIKGKAVILKKGGKIEIGLDRLRYAGEGGIGSQDDHNRGPLVLYKIEAVYFLHTIIGTSKNKMIGKWIYEYQDGTSGEEEIRIGENIGNKDIKAEWAKKAGSSLYLTEVISPYSGKDVKVKSIRIEIGGDVKYVLVGMTCKLGREPPHTG